MWINKRKAIDISILVGYVGLIYSTLPVAPKIFFLISKIFGPYTAAILNAVVASAILIFIFFSFSRIKAKNISTYLGLAAILSIYSILLGHFTPIIAEKVHLIEYGLLSYLALRLFKDVRSRDAAYLYVVLIVCTVGYLDEFIQKLLPNRVYDLRDVWLNALSGLLGLACLRLLD